MVAGIVAGIVGIGIIVAIVYLVHANKKEKNRRHIISLAFKRGRERESTENDSKNSRMEML